MKAVIYITNSDIIIPKEIESAVVFDADDRRAVEDTLYRMWPWLEPNQAAANVPQQQVEQRAPAKPKSSIIIAQGSEKVDPQ